MKVWDVVQGTAEWAEARRGRATASRFKDIITAKKAEFSEAGALTYSYELLAERIVSPHYWIEDDYSSRAMRNGTFREQEARAYYELITGKTCQKVGFISTDDGFLGASPDSLVDDDDGLELKCPLHKTQIKYLLNPDELLCEYRAQCHGGMIVTKRKKWTLMSYAVGLPPVIHEFKLDEYTVKLTEAIESFRKVYDELATKLSAIGDPVPSCRENFDIFF